MITLTMNGQEMQVSEGRTILEAAREHRIPIPTLCFHEALEPYGACRMCVVELENRRGGQLVPACTHPCEEGLMVNTDSENVRRARRMTLELLMAASAHVPIIRQLADELGVGESASPALRWRRTTASSAACVCGLARRS
jgi:NADH dehydrogenase/NADH:ubiquinone oxidoreductase subunit G